MPHLGVRLFHHSCIAVCAGLHFVVVFFQLVGVKLFVGRFQLQLHVFQFLGEQRALVLCFRQFVRVALYFSLVFGKCFFGRFDLFLQGFGFLAVLACCLGRFVIGGFGLIELVLQL